jgi:hypothetical protein
VSIKHGKGKTVYESDYFDHIQNLIYNPCKLDVGPFNCENYRSRFTLTLFVVEDCRYIVFHFYFNNNKIYNINKHDSKTNSYYLIFVNGLQSCLG